MAAFLSIQGLRKSFGAHEVLKGVDLDVRKGEVVALIEPQARSRQLAFALDLPADLPPVLLGDPVRVHRVLMNLLGNAVKFTSAGQVGLAVHALARDAAEIRLRFEISDTGIGISEEAQARLFTPFVQADSSTTRRLVFSGKRRLEGRPRSRCITAPSPLACTRCSSTRTQRALIPSSLAACTCVMCRFCTACKTFNRSRSFTDILSSSCRSAMP